MTMPIATARCFPAVSMTMQNAVMLSAATLPFRIQRGRGLHSEMLPYGQHDMVCSLFGVAPPLPEPRSRHERRAASVVQCVIMLIPRRTSSPLLERGCRDSGGGAVAMKFSTLLASLNIYAIRMLAFRNHKFFNQLVLKVFGALKSLVYTVACKSLRFYEL